MKELNQKRHQSRSDIYQCLVKGLTGGTCEHKWLAVEEDFDITGFCETWWCGKNQWETLLPGYETKVKSFNLRDEGIAPQPQSLPSKKECTSQQLYSRVYKQA